MTTTNQQLLDEVGRKLDGRDNCMYCFGSNKGIPGEEIHIFDKIFCIYCYQTMKSIVIQSTIKKGIIKCPLPLPPPNNATSQTPTK